MLIISIKLDDLYNSYKYYQKMNLKLATKGLATTFQKSCHYH